EEKPNQLPHRRLFPVPVTYWECAQRNTLNQYSIISVLGCQRLWGRATTHSSGGVSCKAHEVHYGDAGSSSRHIVNQRKVITAMIPPPHLTNARVAPPLEEFQDTAAPCRPLMKFTASTARLLFTLRSFPLHSSPPLISSPDYTSSVTPACQRCVSCNSPNLRVRACGDRMITLFIITVRSEHEPSPLPWKSRVQPGRGSSDLTGREANARMQ
ncbi:unnamed protein product, partial [Pleuronectes platessa]